MEKIKPRFRILFRFILIELVVLFLLLFTIVIFDKIDHSNTIDKFVYWGFFIGPFMILNFILLLLIPIGGIAVNRVTKNTERIKGYIYCLCFSILCITAFELLKH